MKKLFLPVAIFIGSATALSAQKDSDSLFVLQYTPGSRWDHQAEAADQPFFGVHSSVMSRLRKEKYIRVGGLYSDKGFMLVKAPDRAKLWELLQADSTLNHDIFRAEIFPFYIFYEGCVEEN